MKKLGRLSETEMEVMQVIWDLATPVTVSGLLAIFVENKGWKSSTMSTILSRLMGKGYLTKKTGGKLNYYNANLSLQDYQKYEAQSLLANLYGGNVRNFVAALVDEDGITQEDIRELKKWFQTMAGDIDE